MESFTDKLICKQCGIKFDCGAAPRKKYRWCMELPNLLRRGLLILLANVSAWIV